MAGLQNHRRRLLITRLLSAQGPEDTNYEPEAGGNVTGLSVRSADSGPVSAGWPAASVRIRPNGSRNSCAIEVN